MTSPLLDLHGAVPADPPDAGVAAHYGDPFREQRTYAAGEGYVDRSHRDVVRVSGPDRLTWLHSLMTQHLEKLEPFTAVTSLVLSPNGHVEHALDLVDDGEAVWAHVEPGRARPLVAFLDSMRFMLRVEVEDVTSAYAVLTVAAASSPAAAGVLVRTDRLGTDLFVPRAELVARAGLAGPPAGSWAYEALRVAAHIPREGRETDHRTIPHEVGWIETAVHLSKGCYRGQETVARVHNLGRPPRRLVFLYLDGSVERLPEHGDPVTADGKEIGFVTSAAHHHELGAIGLALVKRSVAVDAPLQAAGIAASQEVIVSPDAGLHVKAVLR